MKHFIKGSLIAICLAAFTLNPPARAAEVIRGGEIHTSDQKVIHLKVDSAKMLHFEVSDYGGTPTPTQDFPIQNVEELERLNVVAMKQLDTVAWLKVSGSLCGGILAGALSAVGGFAYAVHTGDTEFIGSMGVGFLGGSFVGGFVGDRVVRPDYLPLQTQLDVFRLLSRAVLAEGIKFPTPMSYDQIVEHIRLALVQPR